MDQSTDTTEDLREQIDAAHHDLQLAVGERFTTVNSAAFEATRQIADLRAEVKRLREELKATDEAAIRVQVAREARDAADEFQQEMPKDAATLRWFAERITRDPR